MTAGLVAYLPQIERVYALDCNPHAVPRIGHNFREASAFAEHDLLSRVQMITGSYRNKRTIRALDKKLGDSRTLLLAAHPSQTSDVVQVLDQLIAMRKPDRRSALIALELKEVTDEMSMVSRTPEEYWGEYLQCSSQFSVELAASAPYWNGSGIGVYRIIAESEDATNHLSQNPSGF